MILNWESEVYLAHLNFKRISSRGGVTRMETRSERGKAAVRRHFMRTTPRLFTTVSLRLSGFTRQGQPRKRR